MKATLVTFLGIGNAEWTVVAVSLLFFLFIGYIGFSFFRGIYRK